MSDLAQWLTAQLDADERIARAATKGPWLVDCETYAEALIAGDGTSVIAGGRWGGEASAFESTEDAIHIAAHDPARVLREVEAKRATLAECAAAEAALDQASRDRDTARYNAVRAEWQVLRRIIRRDAAAYSDRPGYLAKWAPSE
jgi:hypothetical protein